MLWVSQGEVSILLDYPGCPGSWTPGCPDSGGWSLTTPGARAPWRRSLTTPGARGPGPPGARSPWGSSLTTPGARGLGPPGARSSPGARGLYSGCPGSPEPNGQIWGRGYKSPLFFFLQPQSSPPSSQPLPNPKILDSFLFPQPNTPILGDPEEIHPIYTSTKPICVPIKISSPLTCYSWSFGS